jgi:hypothetical protein
MSGTAHYSEDIIWPMRKEVYADYRRSEKWQDLRYFALQRAQYQCEYVYESKRRCRCWAGLSVHHLRYPPIVDRGPADSYRELWNQFRANWEADTLENLIVLCEGHHKAAHKQRRKERKLEKKLQEKWGQLSEEGRERTPPSAVRGPSIV